MQSTESVSCFVLLLLVINFVRTGYLGTQRQYAAEFEKPVKEGRNKTATAGMNAYMYE